MSLKIAAAIEANQKIANALQSIDDSPLKLISATAASSASALKKIFRVIAGLAVLGVVIKISTMIMAGRQPTAGGISKADEKVILQEYYQTHGVRPASRIEADLLEVENRRKENEQRQAEREKQREEDQYRKFVEESRRIGNQVQENLRRDEERARYEEAQQKRRLEQEQEAQRQAERARIEEGRRRAGMEPSSRYPR
jgi:flagellar biosynthesis GTPase FlhF